MRRTSFPTPSRLAAQITSIALAALVLGPTGNTADAKELRVRIDQADIIRLDKRAVEVIVGNPSIADVAVQNGKLLVVTGKSVGLTNLMVLDGQGQMVYDKKISVSVDPKHLVTVNKGAGRQTYSCAPACGPVLVPGDTPTFTDDLNKVIRGKLGLAQASAEGTAAQQ